MDTRPEFQMSPCLDFEQQAGHTLYRARFTGGSRERGQRENVAFSLVHSIPQLSFSESVYEYVFVLLDYEQIFGFPRGGSLNKPA